ncbi:MAG TPA: UDPGP type 1 family protein, partial [Lacipirellulaceae bacterium]|nr:UDPGP type 1 family protein [Lacipirellulaceae bacterium]
MTSSPRSTPNRDELAARLKPHKQEYILRFWDELEAGGQAQLARQIATIDFERVGELFRGGAESQDWAS